MTTLEIFDKVKNTAGSNDKKSILKENMTELIKMIFLDTYGPQKYYITKKALQNITFNENGLLSIEQGYEDFHKDLERLSNREVTGKAAAAMIAGMIDSFNQESQALLLAVIDRNLRIGVSFDNFNSIFNDNEKNEKYEVSLAVNLDKVKNVDPLDGSYFASRKLDGVRCEAHIYNYIDEDGDLIQDITFKSRQGKVFTTLDKLNTAVAAFTNKLRGRWVLDGECCITDDEGNEDFKAIMKEITRKDHTIEHPRYKLFDIITQEQFDNKSQSENYDERLKILNNCYDQMPIGYRSKIEVLEQELLTTQEQFDKWAKLVKDNHWEGFMLHKNAPYKTGRSKDLLKVKKFKDAEYVVEGVITGTAVYNEGGAKQYDIASALVISHKGNAVEVGSGLSKEQRLRWYDHPEEIIGKTITVQYFEETMNTKTKQYSLRFPVLKWVYEGERNV